MQLKKHKNSPYLKAIFFTFLVVSTGFLIFNGLNSLQLTGNPMAGGEYVETCVNKKCSGDCYISYCPSHGSESCCQAYCPGESWCGSSSGSGSGSSTSTTTLSNAVGGGAYVTTCGSDQCVNLVRKTGTLNLEYNNSCLVMTNEGAVNFFVPAVTKSDFAYFIAYHPSVIEVKSVSCSSGEGHYFDLDSEGGTTFGTTGTTTTGDVDTSGMASTQTVEWTDLIEAAWATGDLEKMDNILNQMFAEEEISTGGGSGGFTIQ